MVALGSPVEPEVKAKMLTSSAAVLQGIKLVDKLEILELKSDSTPTT